MLTNNDDHSVKHDRMVDMGIAILAGGNDFQIYNAIPANYQGRGWHTAHNDRTAPPDCASFIALWEAKE